MLNQSKTAHQSEIDAVCEAIDFLRFNVHFAERIYRDQPLSPAGTWNQMDYRPLEGFVFAVTPFNFTAIASNLPSVPALMGNTVIWKCASSTVYSNYRMAKIFEEAGLPPGVINFVPGDAAAISDVVLRSSGSCWHSLHGLDGGLSGDVAEGWRTDRHVSDVSAACWRNRRKRLCDRARERRRCSSRHGGCSRRVRVSGAEVQRALTPVRSRFAVAFIAGTP